jgi:ABC-type Zn uptake system ZnuABC Zn-binding protein ZnuA
MKRMLIAFLLITAYAALPAEAAKLKVVTTLNYLQYAAAQIGGENVEAIALANPRQDPHYVTPTPRMNEAARSAQLFIESGLSLDLWAKNVVDASGNPAIQAGSPGHLVATINAPVKELPTEVSRSWGDIHPQGNPHIWLDPLNMKVIAQNIGDRLAKLDPANAAGYQQRTEEFRHRLDAAMFGDELLKAVGGKAAGDILARKAKNGELDSWLGAKGLTAKLGGWMQRAARLRNLKVVSYHKTYVYFAERFGIDIVSELEEKPGIPPPPQHRDAIVEQMKKEGIGVILNDNFYSRDAADYVASKTGARVVVTYIDVGATESVNTYEKLIAFLLDEVLHAAKG